MTSDINNIDLRFEKKRRSKFEDVDNYNLDYYFCSRLQPPTLQN